MQGIDRISRGRWFRRVWMVLLLSVMQDTALWAQRGTQSRAQSGAQSGTRVDWRADDPARLAWLEAHGRRVSRAHVVLTVPRDSMSAAHQEALADSLERGLQALHELVQSPHAWQRHGKAAVHILLAPGRFVSHANGDGTVFIPFSVAARGEAPYLHESAHVLLTAPAPFYVWEHDTPAARQAVGDHTAQWLLEGLPNVLAARAAQAAGLREYNLFATTAAGSVHATCAERTRDAPRAAMREAVGSEGMVAGLNGEARGELAPAYYTCAESFVTFFVDQLGLRAVVELAPHMTHDTWRTALERLAAASLGDLKALWQKHLMAATRTE